MLGFEALAEELGGRGCEQPDRLVDEVAVARCARPEPKQSAQVRGPVQRGVGRRRVDQRRDQLGDAAEVGLEARVGSRVALGESGDLPAGRLDVVVQVEPFPVREEGEAGAGEIDGDPPLVQPQVPPDGIAQQTEHEGAGRGTEAGRELLGHAGSADDLASLQHHRAQARPRQVEGGDEAVVPPADDHGVHHGARLATDPARPGDGSTWTSSVPRRRTRSGPPSRTAT
jgi:hypothetical protein